jgi:uncharacterized protein (TIGR03086 family)
MHITSLIDQHAGAARLTIEIARRITNAQLTRRTPCEKWDLRQLLDHMTAENLGFAAATRGMGADLEHWVGDLKRADPVGDYVAATETLIAAFAEPGVLTRSLSLPLLSREREFTGEQAVMMQLVDSVVHAWDLARTLGVPVDVDDDVVASVLAICERIPDDESRRTSDAVFAPSVPHADDASPLDRVVASLGRSPSWPH